MLSIGKLAVGQERYYEQQVARGLDDYFTGRGESPGRWVGNGAAGLGLRGTVQDGQLSLLMQGRDPRTGEMLREQPVKVAALDLTFSAPKSVSVLHTVADEKVSAALVACHEEAVEAALSYLEQTAVFVSRRTAGGLSLSPGGGFVTAAFRHRMSRALDPQLHTHCVSANLARGRDGRWTALHHPSLFAAAQTAGYLYQAHLRALISERVGLEWGQVWKGAAELADIPREVLEEFSTRRHEMRRAAEDGGIGLGSRAASQAAALATRSRKQYGVETGSWRDEVRARAAEYGFDRAARSRLQRGALSALAREPATRVHGRQADREQGVFDDLAGPTGLTECQTSFDRRSVLRALAQDAQHGERIEALVARGGRFAERRDVLRTARGELTTAELVAVERRLIAAAQGRAGEGVGRVDPTLVDDVLERSGQLVNSGQRTAIDATVCSGHGVEVIEALAGTGKTYTAGILGLVYEHAGCQVIGVAPTGRAVRELAEQAGIAARTLDSIVMSIGRGVMLPHGAVVVLDEAGMAPTRQTAALFEAAQRSACKVVTIGDPGQLHSVQAGGWMRAVGHRVGTLRLSEVMRQRDPTERRALAALHDRHPEPWLSWAREHERIATAAGAAAIDSAVSEWHAATRETGLAGAALIARDNDMRTALNQRARQHTRDDGRLADERAYGPVVVATGDRVICRRNDRLVDVDNGTRGTVRAVHDTGVVIETDGGILRRLPAEYVAEHVEYAYALTGHGMQGGTVERAFVVACPHELTSGWSYTALSRSRGSTRLFVITTTEQRDRDELAPGERQQPLSEKELYAQLQRYMRTRDDEDLAIEQLPTLTHDSGLDAIEQRRPPVPGALLAEAAAERAEPSMPKAASRGGWRAAADRATELQDRLAALRSPEIRRLEGAERRLTELVAHQDQLIERAGEIPPASRRPFAADPHAAERENLRRALAGLDAELAGVRMLQDRRVAEVGAPAQIRAARRALATAAARAITERDALATQLVAGDLESQPRWAVEALGERPAARRPRDLWCRAARGLARYRLENDVTDEQSALGPRPADPTRHKGYDEALARLDQVRHDLGIHRRETAATDAVRLPREYAHMFGEHRAAALAHPLQVEQERMRGLTDQRLRQLAGADGGVIDRLDRRGFAMALRLERDQAHHQQASRRQTDRAAELDAEAATLGWRDHHEREQLRRDAALHRQHAQRHTSDTERIALELQRLRRAGRHPDQWLHENARQLIVQLAATSELQHRDELAIDRQASLAITDPPAHVLDLIGDRPTSGVRLAEQWERLAENLERHRLSYEIDVARAGLLGPEPSDLPIAQRSAYAEQREQLAVDADRYRTARGLPGLALAGAMSRDVDVGAGREI